MLILCHFPYDSGYNVRFIPGSVNIGMADCYIDNTIFEIKAPEGKTTENENKAFSVSFFVNRKRGAIDINSLLE